jgi:transposase
MARKRKRIEMWQIKECLKMHHEQKLSHRQIAKILGIGKSSVWDILQKAKEAKITWEMAQDIDEAQLHKILYCEKESNEKKNYPLPDFLTIHKELKKKYVTRKLLWLEYRELNPEGYSYSQFCDLYRNWKKKCDVCMRQVHKAGEKLFVDFSGKKPEYTDPKTGEKIECELFVAVLGASSCTYAEATPSQELPYWISCHIHAFDFFQGVPHITVPDNLRSAVTKPCRYEAEVNRTYLELADHYDTVVIPARSAKPQDKAKVEVGVRFVQTWILGRLRNRQFFSIEQLNNAIKILLKELNDRKLQIVGESRRELFLSIDKPALKPLPAKPYELSEWKKARVNIDYHIQFKKCFYSVPYTLVQQQVDVRATRNIVEIFFKGKRVASHIRVYRKGKAQTKIEHMPKKHQKHLQWTPSRIIAWGTKAGPKTKELMEEIINSEWHPALSYRRCLGILRLGKKYGNERLEAACDRALSLKINSYRSVKNILENGFEKKPIVEESRRAQGEHVNIRGRNYYQ